MHNQLKILSISIDEDDLLLKLSDLVLVLIKRLLCLQGHIVASPLQGPSLIKLRNDFFTHVLVLQPLSLQLFELLSISLNVFSELYNSFREIGISFL